MPIILALLFLVLPAALLWLIERQAWAKKIGTIVLALPMLLFTLNIKEWSAMAGKAMLSLVFATASVVAIASTLYFFYADSNSIQSSHLAAMSVGVYTGGTANLAAIKSGLDIPNDLYLLFHSFDTLLGAMYMLFMVSFAIPIFRRLLPCSGTLN